MGDRIAGAITRRGQPGDADAGGAARPLSSGAIGTTVIGDEVVVTSAQRPRIDWYLQSVLAGSIGRDIAIGGVALALYRQNERLDQIRREVGGRIGGDPLRPTSIGPALSKSIIGTVLDGDRAGLTGAVTIVPEEQARYYDSNYDAVGVLRETGRANDGRHLFSFDIDDALTDLVRNRVAQADLAFGGALALATAPLSALSLAEGGLVGTGLGSLALAADGNHVLGISASALGGTKLPVDALLGDGWSTGLDVAALGGGVLHTGVAGVRGLAAARGGGATATEGINVWKLGAGPRGEAIERALGHNLPGNFPVIDRFENGIATSIKSIDLDSASYLTGNGLKSALTRYVDKVAGYQGTGAKGWAGVVIREKQITGRGLDLIVPHRGSATQRDVLADIVKYGASRPNPVRVNVIPYP